MSTFSREYIIIFMGIFGTQRMLMCTLYFFWGGGIRKCMVCTLMKMFTFMDGPLCFSKNIMCCVHTYCQINICHCHCHCSLSLGRVGFLCGYQDENTEVESNKSISMIK